ncbi:MAG: hypothetical protein E6J88_05335 [Deltaproteobacteria bacterium]|nr:MAG: hypothetical protein E6J88_05335 [Deltaproteobacteria bacterium]
MRSGFVVAALALTLPAAAQQTPPFLIILTDPTNSHFAKETLGKDVPAGAKKLVRPPATVLFGPEVDSLTAAHDYAGKERARFFFFAQCGIVIELLKQCDAHIKYCAHQCEAWLYQTDANKQLGHAKVTGEKGGTDAVRKLIAQLAPTLEALRDPIEQMVAQATAEREAKLAAERVQRELAKAEKDRQVAEERARKGLEAEERQRLAQAEKELSDARNAEERRAAQERLDRERAEARARSEEARKTAVAKLEEMKARAEEERLRKEADAAAKKLDAEREKRMALERAQASRVIHLAPGQTVAVLEVENDLQGGARNQVNFSLLTDNLRKRVSKSGLGLLVMDRDAIFQILSSNEKKVLECSANCEVHLGQILRADYVISGRLGKQGQAFRLYLLMYRSHDGALLSDAVAVSDELAALDKKAAMASTDLLSVFPLPR